jgi:hypothetical protein
VLPPDGNAADILVTHVEISQISADRPGRGGRMNQDSAATKLFDLIVSQRMTAVIYVAARLGIADLLADGALTVGEIATAIGADPAATSRLVRALATLGICRQTEQGRFTLTAVGAHLAGTSDLSLKDFALLEGDSVWRSWGGLLDSIRTGRTASELAPSTTAVEGIAAEAVDAAMASLSGIVTPSVLAAYDFSGVTRLLDVGGGLGEMLTAILKAYPAMHGTLLDRGRCEAGARSRFAAAGVAGRADFVAGDFLQSVPAGADAIVLKHVVHNWDDRRSLVLLRNCYGALPAGARLLVIERVMPVTLGASAEDISHAMTDLRMLRGPGGAERTEGEFRRLLSEAGFEVRRLVPAGRLRIIEATKR